MFCWVNAFVIPERETMKLPVLIRKVDWLLLLPGLPLIGIAAAGRPLALYLEFPPLTRYVKHAGFSWPVFLVLTVLILAAVSPFVIRVISSQRKVELSPVARFPFPRWGWIGVLLTLGAWTMAWTRSSWFEPLQRHTFSPIWFGYIITVNALTWKRTGRCMMRNRPRYFLGLFIVSAAFWWYFEYLNRFVQNWCYRDVAGLSGMEYFLFATLPFSTVLPAVLSTCELLESMPRLSAGLDDSVRLRVSRPMPAAWCVLLVSCACLACIGIWPDYLFPFLWLSPLLIITGLQGIRGERTVFSGIGAGRWRRICLPALSALICGLLWEMWNAYSLAKWMYEVPFVGRFKVFEMPLLGFAGYLPFGLECVAVADKILGDGAASRTGQGVRRESNHSSAAVKQ